VERYKVAFRQHKKNEDTMDRKMANSSHNNQDTFTKKKQRQGKAEGKEKKRAEKLSFHIIHNISRIFLFFCLI
jgi:hypothetical protein